MTALALGAATFLFVFGVASDAAFLFLRLWLRDAAPSPTRLFLLTRGLGPVLVSITTYLGLLLLPGSRPAVYLGAAGLAVVGMAALGWGHRGELLEGYRCVGRCLTSSRWWRLFGPTGTALGTWLWVFASLSVLLGVALPVVEHDALSAMVEARIMVRDRDMSNYLAFSEPDPQTGFLMLNFRPPFHQTLYAFYGFSAGDAAADLLARATAPVFALLTLILVHVLTREARGWTAAGWAAFSLASTPLFFALTYSNTIDPARFCLSLVALAWMAECRANPGVRLAVTTGVHCGVALFAHTLEAPVLALALASTLTGPGPPPLRRLGLATLLGFAALLGGMQFHYLTQPAGLDTLGRSLARGDVLRLVLGRKTDAKSPSAASSPNQGSGQPEAGRRSGPGRSSAERTGTARGPASPAESLLWVRGQGGSRSATMIWGRLQMFTGVEYFGVTFLLFWGGAVLSIRSRTASRLERLLLLAALVSMAVVLSGTRPLSWSNPRYIATALPFAAPFSGLALARLVRGRWCSRWSRRALVGVVVLPVLLVTFIRGAKIEITNPGDFYARFRSLEWVGALRQDPQAAIRSFWRSYVGIGKTLRWGLADRDTQLRNAHDYFSGVLYVRDAAPPGARVLLFRDVRFFYYCRNTPGTVWYHGPVRTALAKAKSAPVLHAKLREMGFTHVLVDTFSTTMQPFTGSRMGELLADPDLVELVFEKGEARVYELRPVPRSTPRKPGGREATSSTASTT